MTKILVVDDQIDIITILKRRLADRGVEVVTADMSKSWLRQTYEQQPDLILHDFMTDIHDSPQALDQLSGPGILSLGFFIMKDGGSNVSLGPNHASIPFVMNDMEDLVDYIVQVVDERLNPTTNYDDGNLAIDFINGSVTIENEPVDLTPTEFRLLRSLVYHQGCTRTAEEILADVWGRGYKDAKNNLSLYICYLRKKLNDDSRNPKYIFNDWGAGYRFGSKDSSKIIRKA